MKEFDCHFLSYIFDYDDKWTTIFFIIIQIIQTKLSLNLKIHLYETLPIHYSFVVNEIRAKRCLDEIP
jgi:hypothetical protein